MQYGVLFISIYYTYYKTETFKASRAYRQLQLWSGATCVITPGDKWCRGRGGHALPPSPLGVAAMGSCENRDSPSLDGPIITTVRQETEDGSSLPAGASLTGTEHAGAAPAPAATESGSAGSGDTEGMVRQAGRAWMPRCGAQWGFRMSEARPAGSVWHTVLHSHSRGAVQQLWQFQLPSAWVPLELATWG